ncbi:MAG: protein kinase [Gemmatimonadaceae bacterium]
MGVTLATLEASFAGRYVIVRELGAGGMATVYLARDEKHHRLVAVKVLHHAAAILTGVERFLREIRITASLTHPHIVSLIDSGAIDVGGVQTAYYVMPYIVGETLRERLITSGPLPVRDALRIACEVADALEHAHGQGIVHRDIKPENILLTADHAMVADFGIALALEGSLTADGSSSERLTGTAIGIGTPAYMSPEQVFHEGAIDGRTDVYSLACVLYEMLTGQLPFRAATPHGQVVERLRASPPSAKRSRPETPNSVDVAITRALRADAVERFASIREFRAALESDDAGALQVGRRARAWLPLARIAAIATMVAIALAVWRLLPMGRSPSNGASPVPPTADQPRIAVLFLDDVSPGGKLGHIASGLTLDLIDDLARVRQLKVTSANGVAPFRGQTPTARAVARQLGVRYVVTGSVDSSDGLLRVSVRLTDGLTDDLLDSHKETRPLRDLFALQQNMVETISAYLRSRVGIEIRAQEQHRGTVSSEAWQAVQRAREIRDQVLGNPFQHSVTQANALYDQLDALLARAHRLDGDWIVPFVERGLLAQQRALFAVLAPRDTVRRSTSAEAPQDAFDRWLRFADAQAELALAHDSTEPDALALRADIRTQRWDLGRDGDPDTLLTAAERDLRAAIVARPRFAAAWVELSQIFQRRGQFDLADDAAEKAMEADEFLSTSGAIVFRKYFVALNRGRFDDARRWCREGWRRMPKDPRFSDCELTILGWASDRPGDASLAWHLLDSLEQIAHPKAYVKPWVAHRMLIAALLARAGLRDSALAVVGRTRPDSTADQEATDFDYSEAYVRLLLGQRARAIELLGHFLARRPAQHLLVANSRWFERLHGDPDFVRLTSPRTRAGIDRRENVLDALPFVLPREIARGVVGFAAVRDKEDRRQLRGRRQEETDGLGDRSSAVRHFGRRKF